MINDTYVGVAYNFDSGAHYRCTYPSLSKDVWSPEIGETLDVRLVPNTPVN